MNIFILDLDHVKNAQYHVDRHIVKLITEQNQLLCSAIHICGEKEKSPYKLTHKNHPCAVWTRESKDNYNYLINLTYELCKEYTYRYGKVHKGELILREIKQIKVDLPDLGLTPFALAMPDEFKVKGDSVQSYRNYYNKAKRRLHNWKNRSTPEWITN